MVGPDVEHAADEVRNVGREGIRRRRQGKIHHLEGRSDDARVRRTARRGMAGLHGSATHPTKSPSVGVPSRRRTDARDRLEFPSARPRCRVSGFADPQISTNTYRREIFLGRTPPVGPLPAPPPRARDRPATMNLARGRELGIADKVGQMTYRLSNPPREWYEGERVGGGEVTSCSGESHDILPGSPPPRRARPGQLDGRPRRAHRRPPPAQDSPPGHPRQRRLPPQSHAHGRPPALASRPRGRHPRRRH